MKQKMHAFDIGILGTMDATEIAEQIKKGAISSKEAVHCAIERAQALNPTLNAIVTDCFEKPVVQKEEKDAYFKGVPTFIKDLTHVEGLPTLHGSLGVPAVPQKKNEKNTQQVLSTGCVVLGKSSTSEFGLLPAVETLQQGTTLNPIHLNYSTGGSSGGAGALVASGIVPFAHAADGGGSIRIPAACCGLVGLKPSRGRDMESPTSMLPIDIVCQGIVSRTVRDSANYYAAAETYYANPQLPKIGWIDRPLQKRLKIGVFTETPTQIKSHPEVDDVTLSAGRFCESLGHQVELISNPFTQETKIDFLAYWSFITYMLYRFGKVSYGIGFNNSKLEVFTTQMAKVYPKVMFSTAKSIKRLKKFTNYYNSLYDQYDVLLSPVLSHPVPEIGYFSPENNFFASIEKLSQYVNYTTFQNVTGAPAISLPMGQCKNGLPLGVQLAGKLGDDRQLLELAWEIEEKGGLMDWTKIIQANHCIKS
ncbi:amidase [Aureispira sp. CCB-E]|uniref:amidase n=1 Tax=Aureispira sp. CCB-E TaxID=3051121 RepID=UPI0028695FE6|nr:amidase [Aureispira sp. CCB-E]WMX15709.1 amidase [Aureispira sp. CCB-E]